MNDAKYRYILYIIVVVILSTIGIQAYWNYKNYQSSKQQVINDVQTSLDKAVNDYYSNLAENSTIGFSLDGMSQKEFIKNGKFDSIFSAIKVTDTNGFGSTDSINPDFTEGVTIVRGSKADSIIRQMQLNNNDQFNDSSSASINQIVRDSLDQNTFEKKLPEDIKKFTSKIIVSMTTDSLSLVGIDTLIQSELRRKDIGINYTIKYIDPSKDVDYYNSVEKHIETIDSTKLKSFLSTSSKSTLLPKKSELSLLYNDVSNDVFKRIIWAIVISIFLVLAVISCLFYLLHVIKQQKQLAEVKNDLISNITHEFKTPISTIGVALESIQSFNALDDKVKTKTYLDMSTVQLSKLNIMVEKLLETASLDSENLELNFDRYNISEVIETIAEKHKMQNEEKAITYNIKENTFATVDIFHFENAINNIIDNACKYGGDKIIIDLKTIKNHIEITIADNGKTLTKAYKDKIFDKFYRIPKGNQHDVKGFGIGLYYTKKIVEKHDGTITLELDHKLTAFKISIPNV
ncbi:sensor histidine kinase [Psychroserpens sp. Hel_I_66]|uniref:sensor histidine kinase n=1 Tax=Psychroserpens sp. Hel_I_66 TaxID=1250004 RepID=UPI00064597DC|nr:HAMP domain-containing sensor histidine kinase [Psychroserpens sp. Hel_I_66]